MDPVVSRILATSKEEELPDLERYLEKHQEAMIKAAPSLGSAIAALLADPAKHMMGIIWLAYIRSLDGEKEKSPMEGTILCVETLIVSGKYKSIFGCKQTLKRWRGLLHNYAALMRKLKLHRRALHFLLTAHSKYRPDDTHMTPAIVDVLMLSLKYGNTRAVLPILNRPVLNIDPEATGVDATDYCAYYYYGGLVYVVQKNWTMAMRSLESALVIPAHGTSAIMADAYKAYLLVGVIAQGQMLSLPANTPYNVERTLRQLCVEYMDFASACEGGDLSRTYTVYEENRKVLATEAHHGLVQLALQSLTKRSIRELTRVYVTVSLDQMSATADVSPTEISDALLAMIEEGTLTATISRKEGMVSFHDDPSDSIEAAEQRVTQLRELTNRIEALDDVVSLSEPYVTEKLRSMSNYKQLLQDYDQKRKAARSVTDRMSDFFRGHP